jgi:TIR domain
MSGQDNSVGQSQTIAKSGSGILVFISYSHNDKKREKRLSRQLCIMEEVRLITRWDDGEIKPGQDWDPEIIKKLNEADVILLLITPDFMNPQHYAYEVELKRAMQRRETGQVCVIPVLLEEVALWPKHPLAKLQALPPGGKFIYYEWRVPAKGFVETVNALGARVEELRKRKEAEKHRWPYHRPTLLLLS